MFHLTPALLNTLVTLPIETSFDLTLVLMNFHLIAALLNILSALKFKLA